MPVPQFRTVDIMGFRRRWSRRAALLCGGVVMMALGAGAATAPSRGEAQGALRTSAPAPIRRLTPIAITIKDLPTLDAIIAPTPAPAPAPGQGQGEGGVAGGCLPIVTTHSTFDFATGQVHVQAGFAEHEIEAASFVLAPSEFPFVIDKVEVVIGQTHTNPTVTHYSILIWQGIPSTGSIVGQIHSDDISIPHIHLPASGATAVNVAIQFPLTGPGLIEVVDNPAHAFSVGLRIDQHQSQPGPFPLIPCLIPPSASQNAFPVTDIDAAPNPDNPTNNWLFAVDCSQFGGLSGWYRFSQLTPGVSEPSGDWIIRATRRLTTCGSPTGACCAPAGSCSVQSQADCESGGGVYGGDGARCGICTPFNPADLNHDGVVNSLDLGILLISWSIPPSAPGCGAPGPCAADLNHDGLVNSLDLGILLANWTLT